MLQPSDSLEGIPWISASRTKSLNRLQLFTVRDMLEHFPRRHEDRRQFDRFPQDETTEPVCVCGVVTKTALKRFRGWQKCFEIVLEDAEAGVLSTPLTCRWFNLHYVQKMIATGMRIVVYGKAKRRGKQIVIDHPEFEVVENDAEVSVHLKRIAPVHPAGEGVTPRWMRFAIYQLLEQTQLDAAPDFLPPEWRALPYGNALREIHFPSSFESLAESRRLLVFQEFFLLQMLIGTRRMEREQLKIAPRLPTGKLLKGLQEQLPFSLTKAQLRVIEEIRQDLHLPKPMSRLLQGDVGSGKTLVALSAMLMAVEGGKQAALMAPTQILAEQHYLQCQRWLKPLGLRIALRTSARNEEDAMPLFDGEGAPQIIVGTHALLYEKSAFTNLGLAVIDEQHKFGVLQRARLLSRGDAPDLLVMTATPIPRTLSLTIYGDLDVSLLDELPAGRGAIITAARGVEKLPEIVQFLRKQLDAGRQAYIVYPLVEESDKLVAKAATAEFERWRPLLAPYICELLHGRIAPEEKDAVMTRFRNGQTHALVATTVIEVGVDVPNANFMLIENAERFGLAQLHQLRGRIGRGEFKSYCILLNNGKSDEALEKLTILEKTADGFEIAEADLRLRGPGDLIGTAQSGLPQMKLGDFFRDADLMTQARNAALKILKEDALLKAADHAALRTRVDALRQSVPVHTE
ncbi:MAG: ATP-dependent DNA helicase RecG [Chthoniobacterales bacterium]